MKLRAVLSVPYVLQLESLEQPGGRWVCKAAHPELRDCSVEAANPLAAIDSLEDKRIEVLFHLIESGRAVPVPRTPLKHAEFNLSMEPLAEKLKRLGYAHWLTRLEKDIFVS